MIRKVLIDCDIILDVALAREPFVANSKMVLAFAENSIVFGLISSNTIANLYYVLRKEGGNSNAKKFISKLVTYLTVLSIEHVDIIDSLKSTISDFEDALQHYSALRNQCDCIITRNVKDYKNSKLDIYTPTQFLNLYQEML